MKTSVSAVLFILLSCAPLLFGQAESGTAVGTVRDQAGAVVVGAQVTLVNQATQLTRTVQTNAQGQFSATAFPIGLLTATVEQPGFQKLIRTGIQLTAADTITLELQLVVGDVRQTVEVTSTAPLVESQSAAVSDLVTNRQIVDIPLNGRQFSQLILLSPGAVTGSSASGNLSGAVYGLRGSSNYSVNGSQPDNNSYLIDGLVNAGLWLDNLVINPTIDSIQEERAMTSNYAAEYGSSAGMVTIVQTKSGSNAIHGDMYEFLQNADMNANNFFSNLNGLKRTGQRRNEFGATIGGPIKRDKTFFFGDYQGLRIATPVTNTALIPTLAQDQAIETGNFSGLGTTIYNPYNVQNGQRVPFAGNIIPSNLLDPAVHKVTQFLPAPNVTGNPTTNFAISPAQVQRTDQFDVRVDQNFGQSDRFFGKFSYDNSSYTNPGLIPTPANAGVPAGPYIGNVGYLTTYKNYSITTNYTKVISPNVVNEVRIGALRWNHVINPLNTPFNTANAVGIPGININPFAGGLPGLQINGQSWYLGDTSTFPENNRELTLQFEDIITLIRGSHSFRFGGRFLRYRLDGYSAFPTRGNFTFSGVFTSQIGTANPTPTAFADWALGAEATYLRNSMPGTIGMRFWDASGFGDDTWRITNNLTLNIGLRYEIQAPPSEVNNRWSNLDVTTGQLLVAGSYGHTTTLRNIDYNNFAPRVGLAYSFGKNQSTVIRSGFGISYDEAFNAGGEGLFKNAPNFLSQSYTASNNQAPSTILSQGIPLPAPTPIVNGVVQLNPGAVPYAIDFHAVTPKVLQWSFSIQHQLAKETLLELGYVGTRGIDLFSNVNYNQAFPGSGAVQARRPLNGLNPNLAQIIYWTNFGGSKYQSFQAKLTKRYSNGLNLGVAYTYAHALANVEGVYQSTDIIQNARCYACEWSNAPEDRRHVFVLNHVYELPFGNGRKYLTTGVLGKIAGGWDVSGVWTAETGGYFNITMASSVSNTGLLGGSNSTATNDRPNLIANPNLPASRQSIYGWFNTAAFATPAQNTFGNAASFVAYGPGLFNLDASVHRNFQLTERWRLQFRAEAFNTFNNVNFSNPTGAATQLGSATFGRITAASAARILQMSAKIYF